MSPPQMANKRAQMGNPNRYRSPQKRITHRFVQRKPSPLRLNAANARNAANVNMRTAKQKKEEMMAVKKELNAAKKKLADAIKEENRMTRDERAQRREELKEKREELKQEVEDIGDIFSKMQMHSNNNMQ